MIVFLHQAQVNLRVQEDGTVIIIDTEYGSFDITTTQSEPAASDLINLEFEFPVSEILDHATSEHAVA